MANKWPADNIGLFIFYNCNCNFYYLTIISIYYFIIIINGRIRHKYGITMQACSINS